MTPNYILDTSALLAVLFRETGHEQVAPLLGEAAISSVNYLETITKQMKLGADRDTAVNVLDSLGLKVLPWDLTLAEAAASLSAHNGLSLGDRVCLATARHLRLPAVTADRAWKNLPDLGIELRLIR